MYLLKNGFIIDNNKLIKKDIYIKDNIIVDKLDDYKEIDCTDLLIMPGACDLHVHLREPGFIEKETIKTGTLSAAKGGVTTLVAMPNVIPYPDCEDNIKLQLDIIKKDALVNVLPLGCITCAQKGNIIADLKNLAKYSVGFSDDGVGIDDMALLKEAALETKVLNKIIISHAEVGNKKYLPDGEYEAVKRELEVALDTDVRYHFCHMSTKEALSYIKEAKTKSDKITCEIAPHHFVLNKEQINNNPNFKMNPPLRSEEDRLACISAIVDGTCDLIATDHAPHTEKEKQGDYDKALNGIIGLETFLPLVYTYLVETKLIDYNRFLDLVVNNPRKVINLDKRTLDVGMIADICCLDIKNYHTYTKDEIVSKGKNSPFIGYNLLGFNKYTFCNGKLVYERKD